MRTYAIFVLATLAAGSLAGQEAAPAESLALGRRFTRWFYAAQWDSLLAHQPAQIRSDTTLRPQLERRLDLLRMRGSQEEKVLAEKFVSRNGHWEYWRVARFSNQPEPLVIRWLINSSYEIVGMALNILSGAPPLDSTGSTAPSEPASPQ